MELPKPPLSRSLSRAIGWSLPIPLALLASCGGGGGSGSAGRAIRTSTATVRFPPPQSQTDATGITVRGTANDPDGVVAVAVGPFPATSSDGFATWEAEIKLDEGLNVLPVDVTDARGAVTRGVTQIAVEREPTVIASRGVVFDASTGRLVVADGTTDQVHAVDLATGESTVVSAEGIGAGPLLRNPRGIALDEPRREMLVTGNDAFGVALFSVSLEDGDRRVVRGEQVGSGASLEIPTHVTVDSAGKKAYVADLIAGVNNSVALLEVALLDGATKIIADGATGSGQELRFLHSVAFVESAGVVLVYEGLSDALLAIDIATGDRTLVSGPTRGSGPDFGGFSSLVVRSDGAIAWAFAPNDGALLEVDLVTGDRVLLADETLGSGPPLRSVGTGCVIDEAAGLLAVTDGVTRSVLRIELATGDRVEVNQDLTGSGPGLHTDGEAFHDVARRRLLQVARVSGNRSNAVLAIDTRTGDRSEFSGPGRGVGPPFDFARELAGDPAGGRVFVADNVDAIFAVDIESGERTIIASETVGAGGPFELFVGLAFDADRQRLYTLENVTFEDEQRVQAVELATGDRTLISSPSRGSGPLSDDTATTLLFEAGRNRLLIVAENLSQILAVNVVTGDRTVLSGPGVGAGPDLKRPHSGLLDADRDRLLVIERDLGANEEAIVAIDLATGDRTILVQESDGTGPILDGTSALASGRFEEQLFVVASAGVLLLDLESGDRVLYSK